MDIKKFVRNKLGLSGFVFDVPICPLQGYGYADLCHINVARFVKEQDGFLHRRAVSCWYVEQTVHGIQAVYHSIVRYFDETSGEVKYLDLTPFSQMDIDQGLVNLNAMRTIVLEPRFRFDDPKEAFAVAPVTTWKNRKDMWNVNPRKLVEFTDLF